VAYNDNIINQELEVEEFLESSRRKDNIPNNYNRNPVILSGNKSNSFNVPLNMCNRNDNNNNSNNNNNNNNNSNNSNNEMQILQRLLQTPQQNNLYKQIHSNNLNERPGSARIDGIFRLSNYELLKTIKRYFCVYFNSKSK